MSESSCTSSDSSSNSKKRPALVRLSVFCAFLSQTYRAAMVACSYGPNDTAPHGMSIYATKLGANILTTSHMRKSLSPSPRLFCNVKFRTTQTGRYAYRSQQCQILSNARASPITVPTFNGLRTPNEYCPFVSGSLLDFAPETIVRWSILPRRRQSNLLKGKSSEQILFGPLA